jgi:hypothetical protein
VCQEWKEETINNYYMVNKSKPELGYTPACRICLTDKSIERRHVNVEKTRKDDLRYYYDHKDKCFVRMKRYKTGNKEKVDEDYKAWTKRNPDKLREYNLKHRNHDISNKEWDVCLQVFGNKCAYCGLSQEKHIVKRNGKYIIMNFHKEHVDDEGYNDIRNAVPACLSCNSSKHQHNMEEWFRKQKFFDEERLNKIIWWITEGYKECIEDKPPYRIIKKMDLEIRKFYHELWSVDEKRNILEVIATKIKKKDLEVDIKIIFNL